MVLLWLFISFLTIIALGFILVPLLYSSKKNHRQSNLNVALYREQLKNLDAQLKEAAISIAEYEKSREELTQALLDDVPEKDVIFNEFKPSYVTAGLLFLIIPIVAVLLYLQWGNSQAFSQWLDAKQQKTKVQAEITKLGSMENIIAAMRAKLAQDPTSAKGWYLLGKLYLSQQQFQEAAAAFAKANDLNANDPEIMQNYAESLFFVNQAKLNLQIKMLLNKILMVDPNNVRALNLYAIGFYRAGNYQSAIYYWEKLLPLFPVDSADSRVLLAMIAKAQRQLKGTRALNGFIN